MKRLVFVLLIAVGALMRVGPAAAEIRVEPDDFPNRWILTHAVPGVTLSMTFADGTLRGDFSIISSEPYGGTPSTGTRVFGAASSTGEGPHFYYASGNLRADFDTTIHAVSIDFIGCCDVPGDPQTQGLLRAFSSSGVLLASEATAVLPRGIAARTTVTSPGTPIAYVLASTTEGSNATYLDNLVASAVPAPPAAWLLAAGLMLVAVVARRGSNRR